MQKVIIIGGGPAGYTAAIYSARAGLNPILFEGPNPGGQLMITSEVENFPGYPSGVLGPKMMQDFKDQALRFNTKIIPKTITDLDIHSGFYKIKDSDGVVYSSLSLIIATGSATKWLGLESEKFFIGKGVSSCATCDGFFFKNQNVAVVGGGDSAAEEALYLSNICASVTLFVRSDKMRASHIMCERLANKKNISIRYSSSIVDIKGDSIVRSIIVRNNSSYKEEKIYIDGVFIAIGHIPNSSIFKNKIEIDKDGYIITKNYTTQTSLLGIFAAGDVQDKIYRQAITSSASGCMAALDAEKYLNSIDYK